MRTYLLFISVLTLFFSCREKNTNAEAMASNADSPVKENADSAIQFKYDSTRDGMLVYPKGTLILGDTLGIKFYEVSLAPGDSMPLHSHPDHVFYALSDGKGVVYMNGGPGQEGEMKAGETIINGPVSDAGRNTGKTTLKFIVVDIYRPRK